MEKYLNDKLDLIREEKELNDLKKIYPAVKELTGGDFITMQMKVLKNSIRNKKSKIKKYEKDFKEDILKLYQKEDEEKDDE